MRYFGTDGIRGRVGEAPMSPDFVLRLGRAAGRVLAPDGGGKVVIGKDTRSSGYMFESALEAGFSAAGMNIRLLGPMPTPAIAYLTRTFRAEAGVVISASHNPYYDNGIKFFGKDGRKLPDAVEEAIERELAKPFATVESDRLGVARRVEDAAGRYTEFCKASVPYGLGLGGLDVVLDCANGATYRVAPQVLDDLGARVTVIGASPDGLNINAACGSTQPDALVERVRAQGAHVGIALDGDGDRVVMVDEAGSVVDGDELLFIIAGARQRQDALTGPVVGTVMSNLGLEQALVAQGVDFRRAKVGDRHVLAMLDELGGILGGEASGHLICLDRTTTGDGIIAALQVLQVMVETGRPLSELRKGMTKFPHHLVNVRVEERFDPLSVEEIATAVGGAETRLGADGRVLLRASGTEPLIRVMVEGADAALVAELAEELAATVGRVATEFPRAG